MPTEPTAVDVAQVALPVPLHQTYDYRVPAALQAQVAVGKRVLVPFGPRTLTGFVMALRQAPQGAPPGRGLRDVLEVLDDIPALTPDLLALGIFAAEYYLAPIGEVLRAAVPAGIEHGIDKRLTLTDEGRLRLGIAKGEDGKILDALALGPRRWRDVVRFGAARLDALAQAGLLQIAGETQVRVKRKLQAWAQLSRLLTDEDLAVLQRAPKQRALALALRQSGEASVPALREVHGELGDALARLVERGLVVVENRDVLRDPFEGRAAAPHPKPALTDEQARALMPLRAAVDAERYAPFLLQGVTGSGKTEIYLQTIEHALARGRTAIVLVPEISLTPQLSERFRGRFGDEVAVLHSGLSDAERYDQWRRLRGELGTAARIALGARSALFAPLPRLGVIVVDEEHDPSFKQDETPRYHARDLAMVRARETGATVILGSATPSLESLHNARTGKLELLLLPTRVRARPMPDMELVDLTTAELVGQRSALLSRPLCDALQETVDASEQAILFLNRRGYSSFVLCRDCGRQFECRNCSVSLTHHQKASRLVCHYCGYSEAVPQRCPDCQSERVGLMGVGTERIEDALRALMPAARLGRLDRDTVTSRGRLEAILSAFARRELDVLIGTQMVAKGHDFPGVTLVGVVFADQGLGFPDFRAAERTFQLLRQVSGRAGRGDKPGRVLVQSYRPNHLAIAAAMTGDDALFYQSELALREQLGYPPHGRMVAIRCEGTDVHRTRNVAAELGLRARALIEAAPYAGRVGVMGPAESPLGRLHGRTRWQMLLRGRSGTLVRQLARALYEGQAGPKRDVRVILDVDPINLL